jgi:ABC-2 type transport system permease protein
MDATIDQVARDSRHAPLAGSDPARRSLLGIWLEESRCEILKAVRMPAYSLPTLAFPAMFYLLFGVAFGSGRSFGPVPAATYLLATYCAFGAMGVALFGFGVGVAVERGQGWMLVKRASPMPVWACFAGKMAVALLFTVATVVLLVALAVGPGDVAPDPMPLLGLAGTVIAGALPFCALGLFLSQLAGPNSAAAVVNLIYLPMGFLSGMWIPIEALPGAMQKIAVCLPAYHYSQLALRAVGAGQGQPIVLHVAVLLAFTLAALGAAGFFYRRDEGRTWG